MKSYNLMDNTGEVSLDDLFQMRMFFVNAVDELQTKIDGDSTYGTSIEGNGFNIAFPLKGKEFFLRCELRNSKES